MKIIENYNLVNDNSYRIKSVCKTAVFPTSEEDIVKIYKEYSDVILLGSGHNVILSKDYYENTFIIISKCFDAIKVDGCDIELEAGAWMTDVSIVARDHNLTGLEVFYDIPSSVGGAIVMNAGASGEEIKDVLVKVRYLNLTDFTINEIFAYEIDFEYRNSFFQKRKDVVILKAWLQLSKGKKEDIFSKMERMKKARWEKQPKNFPNAGSVFKRPKGYFVGAIMDELKLKGTRVGGAQISEKHGGFIVNCGNAKGQDVIDLINLVNHRVKETYGFELEVEQRII